MTRPETSGEPFCLEYREYDPAEERRREALFAVGNGLVSTRACWPGARGSAHYPGTYRAGLYGRRRAETPLGSFDRETLVNLPDWLSLRLTLGNGAAPFSIDETCIEEYLHRLDMRAGTCLREMTVRDAGGRRTCLRETRLASFDRPVLTASLLEIRPLDWSGEVRIDWGVDAAIENRNVARYAPFPCRYLDTLELREAAGVLTCHSRTMGTEIEIVQAQQTRLIEGAAAARHTLREPGRIATVIDAVAERGEALRVETIHALRDTMMNQPDLHRAALDALADAPGFDALAEQERTDWADLWRRAGLEVERPAQRRAVTFHAFHVLQAAPRSAAVRDVGVPSRGWHGEAYQGHVFWDELFVLPFLVRRFPDMARDALLYRYRRLDAARRAAQEAGFSGAMYPWRSASDGREVTPLAQYNILNDGWMQDHTHRQRHIGAAIVRNLWDYVIHTGDERFLEDHAAEMILEIARFFASRAEFDPADGRYHILGVLGPDEYHDALPWRDRPGLDDNAYTNAMAVWSICRAFDVLDRLPGRVRQALTDRLCVRDEELARWDEVSRRMAIVFHEDGVIAQFRGYDRLRPFSDAHIPERLKDARVDWALHAIGDSTNAYQINKQADVLTLFYLLPRDEVRALLRRLGYDFDNAMFKRTTEYYMARSTHRSSLSRVIYAGALVDCDPDLSSRLAQEALDTDLRALKGESIAEGVHLGAMGGTLDLLMRHRAGRFD